MKITLNGEAAEISAATLDLALEELGYRQARIATAVNGTFTPIRLRPQTLLQEGDVLDVVAPMQGG